MAIKVRTCKLFKKTAEAYTKNKQVKEKLVDFIRTKTENPQAQFGSKDRPFTREGNLSGYWHAGLSFDVSVIYKIGATNGEKRLISTVFFHMTSSAPVNLPTLSVKSQMPKNLTTKL